MIRLDGLGLERMLNRMLQAGLYVWNVRRQGRACLTLEMRARDFPRLRILKRGVRCRIHIIERHGAPFLLEWFRFRRLLLLGGLLLGLLLLFAQTRIWDIRVEGCERVPEAVVLRALSEAGAQRGMARTKSALASLGQAVRAYDERIAWAGARMEGVTLVLKVVEAEPIPERPDKSVPADVVAIKDGIIEKVTALSGKASVKPGDAVRAGELLIRGDITREGAAERLLVFAEGEVNAQVWYKATATLPNTRTELLRSGRTEDCRALVLSGRMLFRSPPPFSQYEYEVAGSTPLRGLVLPLTVQQGVWHELTEQQVEADLAETTAEALFRAEIAALDQVPKDARILKKVSETEHLPDGSVRALVAVCTLEQIGKTRPIA